MLFCFCQVKYSVVFLSFELTDTYFMAHCKFYLENYKCELSNYWVYLYKYPVGQGRLLCLQMFYVLTFWAGSEFSIILLP